MRKLLALLGVIALGVTVALGQVDFNTPTAGINARGMVIMCLNSSSQAVPCSTSGSGSIFTDIYNAIIGPIPAGTNTIGSISPSTGVFTDRSGAISVGGTSQTLAAANAGRKRIIIQNPCTAAGQNIVTAENLNINFTSAAGNANGTSIELLPCGSYDSGFGPVSTEAITVNTSTSNHKWVAKEM